MESRFFLELSFKGTHFFGWQVQPQVPTVQQAVTIALSTVLGKETEVTGAGRTDTGVHARHFFAHFDADEHCILNKGKLVWQMNGILSRDIVIHGIHQVKPGAHARFSASARTYQYVISQVKDPFHHDFEYYYPAHLDMDAMNEGCKILPDYQDFTSFSKLHSQTETNLCTIIKACWEHAQGKIIFKITADRFLRNMVRAIVGTLIQMGTGRLKPGEMHRIIESRNRSAAGPSAPAQGLTLINIEYPEDLFISSGP